ncbi:MAG: HlyD family efflux transporter periplasmic adaptor subunit [Aliiglaciecola sp.]|uniref:HlyD family efflux transporter periplasmic adaptor subunit n=1 Tax=Aliiglaciecola sp. TaxID=1872441 RepID=UPI0032984A8C
MTTQFNSEQLRRELNEVTASTENRGAPWFLLLCSVLLSSFIGWAYWAEISEITRGQGKVIPSSQQQTIQSLEGGILNQLMVKEGQIVEAGEILLKLDETRFKTAFMESLNQSQALQASIARLEAETLGLEKVVFPENLLSRVELIDAEIELFNARQQRLEASESAFLNKIKATKEQLSVVQGLVKRQAAGALEVMKLKSELADQNGKLTEIRNAFEQEAYGELATQKSELISLQQVIAQRRDQLNRTNIVSPVRGIVNNISISTVGGVIGPGDEIMQITPLEDRLVFETKIRPQDIAFIAPNMAATVKISAYDYAVYGGLTGTVERISADTIIENTPKGEASYYKVLISTEQNYMLKGENKLPIKPGMLAEIDIQTEQRTVLQYLLKPLKLLELR